jgi:hypothetical protein
MHHTTASEVEHATRIPSPNDLLAARDVATTLGVTTDWVHSVVASPNHPRPESPLPAPAYPRIVRDHRSRRHLTWWPSTRLEVPDKYVAPER